ncbi:MAG: hypothetical protein ACAI43_12300 [Phycisphaerae bacterium]|nr:hypothetical protein [Tepidisphaeraceae bacterium]
MTDEKIRDYLHRQPFQPFDIRVSDGRCYTVDHPDFLMRSRGGRLVYLVTEDDREIVLDVEHIVSMEVANRPKVA